MCLCFGILLVAFNSVNNCAVKEMMELVPEHVPTCVLTPDNLNGKCVIWNAYRVCWEVSACAYASKINGELPHFRADWVLQQGAQLCCQGTYGVGMRTCPHVCAEHGHSDVESAICNAKSDEICGCGMRPCVQDQGGCNATIHEQRLQLH